jgi:hypothetical protein
MNYNKKENDQSVMTVTGIDNLVTFVYVVILLYSPRLQLRHTIRQLILHVEVNKRLLNKILQRRFTVCFSKNRNALAK